MNEISNVMTPTYQVTTIPKLKDKVNFRSMNQASFDYDSFKKMEYARQKEIKKEKIKRNLTTGLTLSATALMAVFFGRALIKDIKADRMLKQAYKNGGPTAAQRELGFKTQEELMNMFKDVSRAKSFDDIVMDGELRKTLDSIVERIEKAKDYDEYMQEINNAILFYGPPGTGKTTFVLALCKKLGIKPFMYDMGQLKGGYQGVMESNMEAASKTFLEAHKAAREKDPRHISILFFDECDEIFQKAVGANANSDNQILNRFKKGFNEWKDTPGVYIFGNTNSELSNLNNAILDRMTHTFIPTPPAKALENNLFHHYAKGGSKIGDSLKKPTRQSAEFFNILSQNEYNHPFSFRDLENIGWKLDRIPENGKQLTLKDIIQNAIDHASEIGLSPDNVKQLEKIKTQNFAFI